MINNNPIKKNFFKKILIISFGSMGKKYLEIINNYWSNCEVGVLTQQKIIKKENINTFNNFKDAIKWNPSAAIIASPASDHIWQANILLELGIPVLIEKPVGTGTESENNLKNLLKYSTKTNAAVGYVLRHSPCANFLKNKLREDKLGKIIEADFHCASWLPSWRENDYRKSVSSQRATGGGILLEMSHEIDMAFWLFDEIKVIGKYFWNSNTLEIDKDVEDVALIIGKNNQNIGITIRLNFCTQIDCRKITIRGIKGELIWDILGNKVFFNSKNASEVFKSDILIKDLYKIQLEDFAESIISNKSQVCSLKEGLETLEFIKNLKK